MNARLCLLAVLCVFSAARAQQPAAKPESHGAAEVARGHYLVTVGGCNDCHSPKLFTAQGPEPDPSRLLSGHPASSPLPKVPSGLLGPNQWGALVTPDLTAWVGPWGTSFAANLTPDTTGLGPWKVQDFISAIRTGKHLGVGRSIRPPMPWAQYRTLTDADLRAIFAYLRSLKPIANLVPEPLPPAAAP